MCGMASPGSGLGLVVADVGERFEGLLERPRSAKVVTATSLGLAPPPLTAQARVGATSPVVRRSCRSVCARAASARGRSPDDGAQLPRGTRAKRSAARPRIIAAGPRQCISQKPTTARDLRRASRAHLVLLARGDAVDDHAPEGASARSDCSKTSPPAISKTTSTRSPAVGLLEALAHPLRRGVDRRVGAELERERRASPASRRWRSRARAQRPRELDRRRAGAAAPPCTTTDSPSATAACGTGATRSPG
jgi:hypothetical protein